MLQSIYNAPKGSMFDDCVVTDVQNNVGKSADKFKHQVTFTFMGKRYICNAFSTSEVSDFVVMQKYTIVVLAPGDERRPPLIKKDTPRQATPPATEPANLPLRDMLFIARDAMQSAVEIHSREAEPGTAIDIEVVAGTAKQIAKNTLLLAQDLYNEQIK